MTFVNVRSIVNYFTIVLVSECRQTVKMKVSEF